MAARIRLDRGLGLDGYAAAARVDVAARIRLDCGLGFGGHAAAARVNEAAFLVSAAGEEAPGAPHEIEQSRGGDFQGSRGARAGGRGQGEGESGGEQEDGGLVAEREGGHGGSWESAPGAVPIGRAGASPGKVDPGTITYAGNTQGGRCHGAERRSGGSAARRALP